MKRCLSFLVGILFLLAVPYTSLFAQSEPDSTKQSDLSGKWGLAFQVGSDFNLHSYDGASISIKKMTGSNRVVHFRMKLQFTNDESETKSTIQGSLFREFILEHDEQIHPYYGFGMNLLYVHNWYWHGQDIDISLGPEVLLGIEWFVSHNISISGEYSTSLQVTYNLSNNSTNFHETGYRFDLFQSAVRTGVCMYFTL